MAGAAGEGGVGDGCGGGAGVVVVDDAELVVAAVVVVEVAAVAAIVAGPPLTNRATDHPCQRTWDCSWAVVVSAT